MKGSDDFRTSECPGNVTEMAFLVVENEKLRRKLRKSQERRDYYARLYYHLLADVDAMKYELEHARRKIQFLQSITSQSLRTQAPPLPPPPHLINPAHLCAPQWADSRSTDSGTCLSPTDHSLLNTELQALPPPTGTAEEATSIPKGALRLRPTRAADTSRREPQFRKGVFYSRDDACIPPPARAELYLSQPAPSQAHYVLPRPSFNPPASLSQSFPSPPEMPHPGFRPRERSRTMSHIGGKLNAKPAAKGALRREGKPNVPERLFHYQDDPSSYLSAFKPVSLNDTRSQTKGAEDTSRTAPVTRLVGEEPLLQERRCDEGFSRYDSLSGIELLDLLSRISDPNCTLSKLEISNSDLGRPEAMKLFCRDLVKNKSISELSLPSNKICEPSLKVLLECVLQCGNIKELLLRNNLIGKDSINTIKSFLDNTTVDSLVLTGNEIEQCSGLLDHSEDFTLEYNTPESSEDSGNVIESDHKDSLQRLQYLHI